MLDARQDTHVNGAIAYNRAENCCRMQRITNLEKAAMSRREPGKGKFRSGQSRARLVSQPLGRSALKPHYKTPRHSQDFRACGFAFPYGLLASPSKASTPRSLPRTQVAPNSSEGQQTLHPKTSCGAGIETKRLAQR
jgi:hypothetical protein